MAKKIATVSPRLLCPGAKIGLNRLLLGVFKRYVKIVLNVTYLACKIAKQQIIKLLQL
jgi:hypothetical protein